jgi:hypothetical protein
VEQEQIGRINPGHKVEQAQALIAQVFKRERVDKERIVVAGNINKICKIKTLCKNFLQRVLIIMDF